MQLPRNLAEEHGKLFQVEPRAEDETGAQYRERVARTLAEKGKIVYAHEALFNKRMSDDPFAHCPLDRGYGDEFITKMAELTEEEYRTQVRNASREGNLQKWKRRIMGRKESL